MLSSNATNVVLLDTDVTSFFLKGHELAARFYPLVESKLAAISFMTVAELFQWAEMRQWGQARRSALEHHLSAQYLKLGVNDGLSQAWVRVRAEARAAGKPTAVQDAWVAATTRYYQIPLVTHNEKHFSTSKALRCIRPKGVRARLPDIESQSCWVISNTVASRQRTVLA